MTGDTGSTRPTRRIARSSDSMAPTRIIVPPKTPGTTRRFAPSSPPPPPRRGWLVAVLAGAGAFVTVVVLVLFVLSKKDPGPAKTQARIDPPAPVEIPKPPEPPKEATSPAEPPSSARSETGASSSVKATEDKTEVKPKPEVPKPPEPPPPPPKPQEPPSPIEDLAAFTERMAKLKADGQKRLEEKREEAAEDLKETKAKTESRLKRFGTRPVTLLARSGEKHADVLIRNYTMHDAEVRSGNASQKIPWDSLEPASIVLATELLFDSAVAVQQFECGKFFIARRMWREAQQAFEKAAKLGDGFEEKVAEIRDVLERVVSGQGLFRGQARRTAHDWLMLTYDFRDPGQLADWSAGLVHAEGGAVLEAKGRTPVALLGGDADQPVTFREELDLTMKVTPEEGGLTLALFAGAEGGYELETGPEGTALFRLPPKGKKGARKELGRNAEGKLAAGRAQEIRLHVRSRKFRLNIDGKEALAVEDPPVSIEETLQEGLFAFQIAKGKLRIHAPLVVHGKMQAADLEKRLSEMEVLLRRAVDDELAKIQVRRQEAMAYAMLERSEDLGLTADDMRFALRIRVYTDQMKYLDLKKRLAPLLVTSGHADASRFDVKECLKDLEELIVKYPDVPALYYLRAQIREERQEHSRVREDVTKALQLFPDFPEALLMEAEHQLRSFDLAKARAALERALAAKPDYAPAYVARSRLGFWRAETSHLEDLHLALRLDPANAEAHHYLRAYTSEARGPKDLGCRFEHETAHYAIVTDIGAEAAKAYGERLEAAYDYFARTFKPSRQGAPRGKPRVAIFNTAENYYTYFELLSEQRGDNTLGVFRPNLNELVLFEALDLEESLHTLYHESFHQFTTLLLPDSPPFWFNEGMAEYMGAIRVEKGKVTTTGLVQAGRLRLLKFGLAAGSTVPFAKIMTETPREFYGPAIGMRYAQAWSMIHFFFEFEKGKYRDRIDAYLGALRDGKTPQETYDSVFAADAETMEKEWKAFASKLKLPKE